MRVNMRQNHIFGSGAAGHYSRINTTQEVLSLTEAAKRGLISRGATHSDGGNGFFEFVDQDIVALVPGLTVTQHHWADPGPDDHPTTQPLPMRCGACGGTGHAPPGPSKGTAYDCPVCKGVGEIDSILLLDREPTFG